MYSVLKWCILMVFPIVYSPVLWAEVILDARLLTSWTSRSVYPCAPPFKATYSKNGKTLTFLASTHETTDENDPRLDFVRREIEKTRPQGVIIERPVAEGEFSGERLEAEVRRCRSSNGQFDCGEPTFAGIVAARNGAVVVGGEIDPKVNQARMLRKLSKAELFIYNSLWILSSMKERGLSGDERKARFIEDFKKVTSFDDSEWSYAHLNSWLEKNMGVNADQVETSWIEPRSDSSAGLTQKIAHKYSAVREPQIVEAAGNLLRSKDNVMLVYGAGHFVKQAPVYAKAFGPPKIECRPRPSPNSDGPEIVR